jgi:orotate phosphoribosyltransferase
MYPKFIEQEEHRLLHLIRERAYRTGDFTLSSGQASKYYIDVKQVSLDPEGAWLIGTLLFNLLPKDTVAIGGLTMGADPLATAVSMVSYLKEKPMNAFLVRKEPKGYGKNAQVESPPIPEGSGVIILEDVVTTGGSALKAVDAVRNMGWKVLGILAVVDREQGGEELYHAANIPFRALFSISEIQGSTSENS